MARAPFPKREPRDLKVLEVTHSDVCDPMRVESKEKARYIVMFIDDYSRWCEIRLLKRKDEILATFKEFKAENLHRMEIKFLQTDNGKEF